MEPEGNRMVSGIINRQIVRFRYQKILMRSLFTILLFLIIIQGNGQERYHLRVVTTDAKMRLSYRKSFADSAALNQEISDIVNYLHEKAYLEARHDSSGGDTLNVTAYITAGKLYHLRLIFTEKPNDSTEKINRLLRRFRYPVRFNASRQQEICEIPVTWLENHGYPFASARLSDIRISQGNVTARLQTEQGPRIYVDSLVRKGNIKISKNYIYRYCGIRPGQLYNETDVRRLQKRLEELPFAAVEKNPEIAFWQDKAKIYLYLNKKKASSFSGLIGVLPNSRVPGKVLINGELKLKLLNAFAHGELISLNWRSLEKATQDLSVQLTYPYILSTPLGVDYSFTLYKKDTSYLTLHHNIGLRYLLGGNNFLQFFTEIFSSDIISDAGLESLSVLPDYADIRKNLGGIEYHFENLDYRFNPRKGIQVNLSGTGGVKTIRRNSNINPSLYDSLDLRTGQFEGVVRFNGYIPSFRRQTLMIGLSAGKVWNSQLFENELYRIGGMSNLRGFDEESIRASMYSVLLLEYRYLFERNSFLALFWNGAYIEKNTRKSEHSDLPYGLGAGISFETRIGIFSLYYALGAQEHGSISFRQSKIHFGISTAF